MKVKVALACCLMLGLTGSAWAAQSKATQRYSEQRVHLTRPLHELAKIKAIVDAIKAPDDDSLPVKPSDSVLAGFTPTEMFTYDMIHGETPEQFCDVMPVLVGEEKMIFAQMPDLGYAASETWSDGQRAYMHQHRAEFLALLRELVAKREEAGVNVKWMILEIDGWEMIPVLCDLYKKDRKDQDLLSLMNLLMKQGNYGPLLQSETFTKLYGPDSNYKSYLVANRENQDLVMSRAMAYYQSK